MAASTRLALDVLWLILVVSALMELAASALGSAPLIAMVPDGGAYGGQEKLVESHYPGVDPVDGVGEFLVQCMCTLLQFPVVGPGFVLLGLYGLPVCLYLVVGVG